MTFDGGKSFAENLNEWIELLSISGNSDLLWRDERFVKGSKSLIIECDFKSKFATCRFEFH